MSAVGSIVIYSTAPNPHSAPDRAVLALAQALLDSGLVKSAPDAIDREVTFVTENLLDESDVAFAHVSVPAETVTAALDRLVFTLRDGDEILPFIDLTAFGELVNLETDEGRVATSAIIEFSYEDVRLDYERIHRIKDDYHELFGRLQQSFGTTFAWTVVPG